MHIKELLKRYSNETIAAQSGYEVVLVKALRRNEVHEYLIQKVAGISCPVKCVMVSRIVTAFAKGLGDGSGFMVSNIEAKLKRLNTYAGSIDRRIMPDASSGAACGLGGVNDMRAGL